MTEIGTGGGSASIGFGINAAEQVVGYWTSMNSDSHAYLYASGIMTDLGTLGGSNGIATAINAAGQVVGGAYIPGDAAYHALVNTSGSMSDLGTLGGSTSIGYATSTTAGRS